MINKMDYTQAAALIKVQEKKMLNSQKFDRMIEADTALEILRILSETDYNKSMVGINSETQYEQILEQELNKTYDYTRSIIRDNQLIVDAIALKYDFQFLKFKLKSEIQKKSIKEIKYTSVELDKYYENAKKIQDIQLALVYLDKVYFELFKQIVDELDIELLNRIYTHEFNKYNLLTFLRLKKQNRDIKFAKQCLFDAELIKNYDLVNYIETLKRIYNDKKIWQQYDKDLKISSIEKQLENNLIDLIKEYKNTHFGVEPIICYIIAKEFEIKTIKLIMISKINKINEKEIRERMRQIYV